MKKVAGIGLGLALVGVGVFQMVHGFQECNGKSGLHWGDKRATSVDAGEFVVKIPPGWRDAAEATDPEMKDLLAKSPGARVLVREDFDRLMIMIKSGPVQDVGDKPPCEELANGLAKSEGSTTSNLKTMKFDGDPGCQWIAARGDVAMQYNTRFHGTTLLLVGCGGGAAGYIEACQQALAGVSLAKH